jgi:S1-C subfamily serine protease
VSRKDAVLVTAVVGALGLIGFTASGATAPAPTDIQERLNLGVVAIDARIGDDLVRSSGTVIGADDGLVITTAHTVWGATSLKVSTALGVLHGRIVARAPCADLALLETQPRIPGLAALTAAPDGAAGELLTAVGRRRADPDAGASSLLTIPVRPRAGSAALRLDSPLVPEASGGPITDPDGDVVALARHGGAATPWPAVQARLEQLSTGPRSVYVGWRDQYRCAARMHAYARRRHPGFHRRDARLNAPVPATRLPGTEELDG